MILSRVLWPSSRDALWVEARYCHQVTPRTLLNREYLTYRLAQGLVVSYCGGWCGALVMQIYRTLLHSEQRSKTIDRFLTTPFSCSGSAVASLAWLKVTNSHMPPQNFSPDLNVSHGCVFWLQNAGKSAKNGKISSLHKPANTLRSMVLHHKEKTPKEHWCGTIYNITCDIDSSHTYIENTQREIQRTYKPGQTNKCRRPLSGHRTLRVHEEN